MTKGYKLVRMVAMGQQHVLEVPPVSDTTPSQAEGEDDGEEDRPEVPRTTPSQAEGEDDDEGEAEDGV